MKKNKSQKPAKTLTNKEFKADIRTIITILKKWPLKQVPLALSCLREGFVKFIEQTEGKNIKYVKTFGTPNREGRKS